MHPLRLLLIVSLAVAAAIGIAFGALLARGGVPQTEAYVIGAIVLGAFMLPWSGVFLWAVRRASDLETLIDRSHFDERPPDRDPRISRADIERARRRRALHRHHRDRATAARAQRVPRRLLARGAHATHRITIGCRDLRAWRSDGRSGRAIA